MIVKSNRETGEEGWLVTSGWLSVLKSSRSSLARVMRGLISSGDRNLGITRYLDVHSIPNKSIDRAEML